jgi:hypothetical protein
MRGRDYAEQLCDPGGTAMSETRRNLFKFSVLSAVGLTSVVATTGCGVHLFTSSGSGPENPGTSPIVGYSDGNHWWYVFVPDANGYKVSATIAQYGSFYPDQVYFDTQQYLTSAAKVSGSGSLILQRNASFSIGGVPFKTDQNAYLDDQSKVNLIKNTNWVNTNVSWNEIGHRV